MKALNSLMISGKEVLPLIEGGKGIGITNGYSSGAWAAAGGAGTFSGVCADFYDEKGVEVPMTFLGKTRRERQLELIEHSIKGGVEQARIAHELSKGQGRIHINVLWEMGGVDPVLTGILDQAKGLIHGITCGAGMPFRVAEIASSYGVYYYPIVSSARAFQILFKRSYHKYQEFLGGVVYEDPWRAGGHNGLSNSEDPNVPQDPYPRVKALRDAMRELKLDNVPIIMAGGVWRLDEWEHWLDNKELGPIAFQFGTRPLLTKESPISDEWKRRLVTLKEGDIFLNRYSPTGFYSSAVFNPFLQELKDRSQRQVAYSLEPLGEHDTQFPIGPRQRIVYLTAADAQQAKSWMDQGFQEALRTPDSTLIFVDSQKADEIVSDQINCKGCLSQCIFSNWSQSEEGTTGKKADPRSFCIHKSLSSIRHGGSVENELMFAGHAAFRFARDSFYDNGFIPTVKQLVDRIAQGA